MARPPVRLTEVELPDFGIPDIRPELSKATYAERVDRFRQRLRDAGLTAAVVYADREHFANLSYLTGFDPRFEEALMVVVPERDPVILTGPENQGTAKRSSIEVEVKLYPPFGLLGQERSRTPPLADLLHDAGIVSGAKVGVVGWKYFGRNEAATPESWVEIPSFIVDGRQCDRYFYGSEHGVASDQRDRPACAVRVCSISLIRSDQACVVRPSRRHARVRGGEPDAADRASAELPSDAFGR